MRITASENLTFMTRFRILASGAAGPLQGSVVNTPIYAQKIDPRYVLVKAMPVMRGVHRSRLFVHGANKSHRSE
jgi:hypothetical protein